MQPGKLNNRIGVYRQTRVADGYGGWSNTTALNDTYWGDVKEEAGAIDDVAGARKQMVEITITMRKTTADNLQIGDTITVDSNSDKYRINSIVKTDLKYTSEIKATKLD